MKKIIICLLLSCALLAGCSYSNCESIPQQSKELPYENISSSGVWLSFSEINAMLGSDEGFKAEFTKVLENCRTLKIGEIYVHIRSYCDSLYKSEYFFLQSIAKWYHVQHQDMTCDLLVGPKIQLGVFFMKVKEDDLRHLLL